MRRQVAATSLPSLLPGGYTPISAADVPADLATLVADEWLDSPEAVNFTGCDLWNASITEACSQVRLPFRAIFPTGTRIGLESLWESPAPSPLVAVSCNFTPPPAALRPPAFHNVLAPGKGSATLLPLVLPIWSSLSTAPPAPFPGSTWPAGGLLASSPSDPLKTQHHPVPARELQIALQKAR